MRENFIRLLDSYRPLALTTGHSAETIDELITNCKAELRDPNVKMYAKVE